MKITNVRLRELTGIVSHPDGPFWEERLIRPVDIYPEYHAQTDAKRTGNRSSPVRPNRRLCSPSSRSKPTKGSLVWGDRSAGMSPPCCTLRYRTFLPGHDALATERLWDIMYRHGVHSRKGTPMFAISAIDAALWDLKGKYLGQPVHRLLGGPTRDKLPAYASMLGYSLEPARSKNVRKTLLLRDIPRKSGFPAGVPLMDARAREKTSSSPVCFVLRSAGTTSS